EPERVQRTADAGQRVEAAALTALPLHIGILDMDDHGIAGRILEAFDTRGGLVLVVEKSVEEEADPGTDDRLELLIVQRLHRGGATTRQQQWQRIRPDPTRHGQHPTACAPMQVGSRAVPRSASNSVSMKG